MSKIKFNGTFSDLVRFVQDNFKDTATVEAEIKLESKMNDESKQRIGFQKSEASGSMTEEVRQRDLSRIR